MTKFIDAFAEEVWTQTYKDHTDTNIDDNLRRVARAISSIESTPEDKIKWENTFYEMLSDFKVTVGGRTYANAGTDWSGTTLMNCFVSPRSKYDIDSLEDIILDLKRQSFTLKSEGGWGQNFSHIRPRGAFINGVGVETPGSIKYMELYDKASEIITSGSGKKSSNKKSKGKIRKGAMMAVLDCWHPDIVEFVTAKQSSGRLARFNMSVNFTNDFMSRLQSLDTLDPESDEYKKADAWDLVFPDTTHTRYKEFWSGDINAWRSAGLSVIKYNTISVKWLWNLVMESTYNRAEPGVLFLDRANEFNPLYYGETISATNPCGEQFLAPGGVCCLASINLTQFIKNDNFDLEKLSHTAKTLVRFLDNVNEYSDAPLPEYIDSMRNKRRIGIGILGWGSALFMLRTKFASDKAAMLRNEIMSTVARSTYEASIDLAIERGMFKYCDPAKHAAGKFVTSIGLSDDYMKKLSISGIRNSSLMSIQPTGNCVTESGTVRTRDGFVSMRELMETVVPDISILHEGDVIKLDHEIEIDTFEGVDVFDSVYVNGHQPVLNIRAGDIALTQTHNHKYLVKIDDDSADWKQVDNLKVGDKIIAIC